VDIVERRMEYAKIVNPQHKAQSERSSISTHGSTLESE
jgi:hypothetical protein